MKRKFLLIILAILAINIYAQSPEAFKYQSVIRDGSGNVLANQATGIQIRILQGTASGTEVYSETHSPTTNAFGLINLNIGSGANVTGTFSAIAWGTDSYFLEIGVDPSGGTSYNITGTSQLLSVPYALYAKTAGTSSDNFWFEDTNGIAYFTGDPIKKNIAIGDFPSPVSKVLASTVIADNQMPNFRAFSYDANGTGYFMASNNESKNFSIGVNGSSNPNGASEVFLWYGESFDVKFGVDNTERMRIRSGTGNLDMTTGDVYIKDATKGVIMKSPDDSCFRMTVSNAGAPVFTPITCPD